MSGELDERESVMMPKPKPVPTRMSCSECGLPWERHEEATKSECIRLLKADLAARPQTTWTTSNVSRLAEVPVAQAV